MATPITHIALAEKVFEKHFLHFQRADFYIGSVFPDIRYLGVIERHQTHVFNVSLSDVTSASSAFRAGVLYHCLVDEMRERFVSGRGIYDLCPVSKFTPTAIKLFEDELYFPHVRDWQNIGSMFDTLLTEELSYDISREAIEKWHGMVKKYCKQVPTPMSVEVFAIGAMQEQAIADEINSLIVQIKNISEVQKIALDFWNQFDDLIVSKQ
ncbi:MAG: hypothetical protein Q8P11_02350 [bacterium]|nr:hypothetical protein [bacterium]